MDNHFHVLAQLHDARQLSSMVSGLLGGKDGKPARYEQGKIGIALFDLDKDIGEKKNLAKQYPEVVQRLQMLADQIRVELGDSATGQKGRGVRPVAQPKKKSTK